MRDTIGIFRVAAALLCAFTLASMASAVDTTDPPFATFDTEEAGAPVQLAVGNGWLLVRDSGADSFDQAEAYLTSLAEPFVTENAATAAARNLADLQANFKIIHVGICNTAPCQMSDPAFQASVNGGAIEQWVRGGGIMLFHHAHNQSVTYLGPGGAAFHIYLVDGNTSNNPTITDLDHEYFLGTFGGGPLTDADFASWGTTVHGQVAPPGGFVASGGVNLGTSPVSGQFNQLLNSASGSSGVPHAMLEYVLDDGYVMADMMTYDWTTRPPNPVVLTQNIDYLLGIQGNFGAPGVPATRQTALVIMGILLLAACAVVIGYRRLRA